MAEEAAAKALCIWNTGREQIAASVQLRLSGKKSRAILRTTFCCEIVLPDSAAGPGGKPYGLPLRADLNAIRRGGFAGG